MNDTFYTTRFPREAEARKTVDVQIVENILRIARKLPDMQPTVFSTHFVMGVAGQLNIYSYQLHHDAARRAVGAFADLVYQQYGPGKEEWLRGMIEQYLEYAETLVTSGHVPE